MAEINLERIVDLYSLLAVEGIGPGKIRNLLSRFRTTNAILSSDLNSLLGVEGISTNLAKRIQNINHERKKIEQDVLKELETLKKLNARVVTIWDSEYPPLLKKIYDPPIIFQIKGELTEIDNFSIAIVGTRMPTNYGKINTERLASELVQQGIPIVSGMARGIDSVAHNSALKNGGRTIAVVGTGLDIVYPSENNKLFKEISASGAVISEFRLGTNPDAQNFPRRNRIISGLSLGTIIIESGIEGGAMQTAAFALDQNREVFALPGNTGVKQSDGTNLLIKKGEASLITNVDDVISSLELKLKPVLGKNIPKKQTHLNLFEQKIIDLLDSEPKQIDKISEMANLSTSDCLVHLLSLEFKGLVKQLPGKLFAAI